MSPKKIGDDMVKATQAWKGIRVTVQLAIANRQAKCTVAPSSTSMLIKELKEPPRDRKKVKNIKHSGNLSFETVVQVARQMREKSIARELRGTILEMLGTCFAVGCTVDGISPKDVQQQIYDDERVCPDQ